MQKPNQELDFRPYTLQDRDWVLSENVRHYQTVEGFSPDFAEAVEEALSHVEQQLPDERSNFVIVQSGNRRIGCVFLSPEPENAGRIRLLYLDSAHRGCGVGRRLLQRIIEHALRVGLSEIRVSTFDRHRAACNLYASLGFQVRSSMRRVAFGHSMTQVEFVLRLSDHPPTQLEDHGDES
ncbi:MAG: GNAT family N-acetyltransferase [Rhodothermales bacterium]